VAGQGPHHLRWQVLSRGVLFLRLVRDVLPQAREVVWQAVQRLALAGQGVPRNEAAAAYWYRQAAAQGDPELQWQLGLKYLHGLGVPQDVVQAYLWLSLATAHLPAGTLRDHAAQACTRAAQHMTPAQWAQAQALVRQWQPRMAPE